MDVLEVQGGEIVRDASYYDLFGLLVQLGVIPGPGGSPIASPVAT